MPLKASFKAPALALAHACADGICAACLFGRAAPALTTYELFWYVCLYTLLAFPAQALVGLLCDLLPGGMRRLLLTAAMFLLPAVWLLPLPPLARVIAAGLLNSLFHTLGGADRLGESGGKLTGLGLFVAPGAIGLAVGSMFPASGALFSGLIVLTAIVYLFTQDSPIGTRPGSAVNAGLPAKIIFPALILLSVACRSMGGSAVKFGWKTGLVLPLVFAACVALGKFAGGALSDRFGMARVCLPAAAAAAILIPLCAGIPALALAGQFCVNIAMPATLMLLYRFLPEHPGFCFGLAAGVLYPGTLAGQYLGTLASSGVTALLVLIFALNAAMLALALYQKSKNSENKTDKNKKLKGEAA